MTGHSFEVFAQDPIFTENDKTFLASRGIKVLEDPEAFDLIDEHTFVYAPFLGWAQWSDAMLHGECCVLWSTHISQRDVIFGAASDNDSSKEQSQSNQIKALEHLCKKCNLVAFPENFSETATEVFQGTAIYWRNDLIAEEACDD